jgi:hypothetical protein
VTTFYPEEGDNAFIQNISIFLPDYTASRARICTFTVVRTTNLTQTSLINIELVDSSTGNSDFSRP